MQFICHLFSFIFYCFIRVIKCFFIYLVWTVTTPGAVVFCCLFYSSLSMVLVSFQYPSSALFISSEHLPQRQVVGCRWRWSECPLAPLHSLKLLSKLLTLILCPRSDSPFGWLLCCWSAHPALCLMRR